MTVPLSRQLECVRRELSFRRRVYARRVANKKMTQKQADDEIAAMEAVEQSIAEMAKGEELAL